MAFSFSCFSLVWNILENEIRTRICLCLVAKVFFDFVSGYGEAGGNNALIVRKKAGLIDT